MRRCVRRFGAVLVAVGLTVGLTAGAFAAPPSTGEASAATLADAPTVASVDLTQLYVKAVYWDLFGREVDPAGLATWTGLLNRGTPRRAVADAITSSDEFRSGLIRSAYDQFLGREPDPAGLAHWLQMMRQGMTIQQMVSYFLGSPEYYALVGGTSESFVTALYSAVLGRPASWDEVHYWVGKLDGAQICQFSCPRPVPPYYFARVPRTEVALGFVMSTERLSMDLDEEYQWYLGRGLDPSGKQTWVTQIQTGTRYEAVIGSIIASDEYLAYIQTWM